ncbi:MAG: hypothetical protein ABSB56_07135 [Nitrososphaerales archaeon]
MSQISYPTCPQTLLERSSDTQNARQPTTDVLMTWIFPCTPVFGRADESVDDAPTHQTEPELGASNDWTAWALAGRTGVVAQAYRHPVASKTMTARHAAFIGFFGSLVSYIPYGLKSCQVDGP